MRTLLNLIRTLGCSTLCLWVVSFLASPASAAVESDTVGYTTIKMEAGKWYQIGTPFVELEDGTVPTINTVFSEGFDDGDLAYILGPDATYLPTRQWLTYNGETGWFNPATRKLDDMGLCAGQAVFFKKAVPGEVVLKGRVSATEEVPFGNESANSWSQIVRTYPNGPRSINEIEWTGVEDGDLLYIFSPEMGTYLPTRQWLTYNGETGWFNPATRKLDDQKFEPYQAFFINKKSSGEGVLKSAE